MHHWKINLKERLVHNKKLLKKST